MRKNNQVLQNADKPVHNNMVSQPKNGRKTNNKSPYDPVTLGTKKISRFLSTSQLMQIMLLGDGTKQNAGHVTSHFGHPGSNNQGKVNGLCFNQHRSLQSWKMLCLVDLRKAKESKVEKLV